MNTCVVSTFRFFFSVLLSFLTNVFTPLPFGVCFYFIVWFGVLLLLSLVWCVYVGVDRPVDVVFLKKYY